MTNCKINGKLLPVKGHFLLYYAGVSTLVSFLPVIGKQMGISQVEVGAAYTIAPILGIIAKPAVGMIADHLKKRKVIFILFIFLSLFFFLSFSFLKHAKPGRPVTFEYESSQGSNYIKYCNGKNQNTCSQNSLESMLKEKVFSNNSEDIQGSSVITNEICHVKCNIREDGINNFCKELITTNRTETELCESQLSSEIMKKDDTNFDSIEFEVQIQPSEYYLMGQCLFLPFQKIRFGLQKNKSTSILEEALQLLNNFTLDTCTVDCYNNSVLNNHMEQIIENVPFESEIFWYYGSLLVLSMLSLTIVNFLSDTLCFQTLGDKPEDFGKQRQWSAVGWGLSALVAGYLVDQSSQGKLLKDYTICFYMMAGFLVIDLILTFRWQVMESNKPKSVVKGLSFLFYDIRIAVFFITCIFIGMCTAMTMNFLFWLIENVAEDDCNVDHSVKLLQGIMVAVTCISQVPFFYFSGWFIKKIGTTHCLTLVLIILGLRMTVYSFINHPWAFVPVELLQGVTFGLFYPVMTSYASEISPPGSVASIQGIVGAAFDGIGMAAGSLVGGVLFKTYGGQMAFRIFGVSAFIYCILHSIVMYFLGNRQKYKMTSVEDKDIKDIEMKNGNNKIKKAYGEP